MNFQLSPILDSSRAFIVKNSELEGRFDPFFYTPQFHKVIKLEELSKYPIKKVSQVSHFVSDGIHKTPSYSEEGLPFIQVNNISEGIIDFDNNIKKVTDEWQSEVLDRYTPKAGDILVTKDGTIGIAATVPKKFKPFSIFVSVLAIRPRTDLVIPEYLRILISSDIVQKQIVRSTRGAVLAHLLLEETRELKIPIPSKKIQTDIVSRIDRAKKQKKQKEAKAQRLLDSIDYYLLSELGIELPEQEENTIQNRIFTKQFSEVSGGRLDPFYYQNHYEIIQGILTGRSDTERLTELLQFIGSGNRPKGGVSNIDSGVLSFGGEHINNSCELEVSKPKYISQEFHDTHRKTETQLKDLLLVKDGATTGKIGIIEKTEHALKNINEHLFILRTTEKINPHYLVSYLNSYVGQLQIKREITGGTVTGITRDTLLRIKVVVPNLKKQTEIADQISNTRKQAKALQQEAKATLEKAKKDVEAIIFAKN